MVKTFLPKKPLKKIGIFSRITSERLLLKKWKKQRNNALYLVKIALAKKQLEQGRGIPVTIEQLQKMIDES